MKSQVNIVVDASVDSVNGYENIDVDQLFSITNGYVESIVFTTLDKLSNTNRTKVFIESLKKLSPGGQLTIKFLNLITLASKIKTNHIDGPKFTDIIHTFNSFWTESDFLSIISSLNDYKLIKIINEDINIIAVIEKNK